MADLRRRKPENGEQIVDDGDDSGTATKAEHHSDDGNKFPHKKLHSALIAADSTDHVSDKNNLYLCKFHNSRLLCMCSNDNR